MIGTKDGGRSKLRLTGYTGRPPLSSGTHSPTGKPVEPCGRLDIFKNIIDNSMGSVLLWICDSVI